MILVADVEKHGFLQYEDYRGFKIIKKGRKDKECEFCHLSIPIGMEHRVHDFGNYETYPTHTECSLKFAASLL